MVSKFTLFAGKYSNVAHRSITSVFHAVKQKFGTPSGITSDVNQPIITAAIEKISINAD
ncbi:MAG: hypothetical protein QXP36_06175 [Conexivisphaerales archaeon]